MLKRLIGLCLLTTAATSVTAAETTWKFTYQGFMHWDFDHNGEKWTWYPDLQLNGTFTGEDMDGNGMIGLNELSHFVSDGITIVGGRGGKCLYDDLALQICDIDYFDYSIVDGKLNYKVFYHSFEPFFWWGGTTTDAFYHGYGTGFIWTDQTTFQITPAPVPEPAAAVLLLAGLLGVGYACRPAACRVKHFAAPAV